MKTIRLIGEARKDLGTTATRRLREEEVDGTKYKSILQAIQFHPVNDEITHVDFLQVSDNKPVSLNIPVKITGNSPGVRAGGKLLVKNND
eukprot:gene39853-52602_t